MSVQRASAEGVQQPARSSRAGQREAARRETIQRAAVVRAALGQLGTPYRYGGSQPGGFDCSGLVVYSYAKAGVPGLPHSAAALRERAAPISLAQLEPGDLLFFELTGKKTSHVGIFVGDRAFVHAPSSGKRIERVDFDHIYWGKKLGRAGRLLRP